MKRYIVFISIGSVLLFSCGTEQTTKEEPKKTDTTTAYSPGVKDTIKTIVDGPYEERHPNGLIKIKGDYMGGKRHGTWLSFYPDGKMWSEGSYKNGLRDGRSITYYENGNKRYEGNYSNDKEYGVWKYWNENGTLAKEIDYTKK